MPTVNNNFSSLITAIDTKAQSLAASTTNPKDLVFLGKTLEALNITGTVADVIAQGDTQVAAVNAAGATQVAAVAAQGSGYASLANPTFTGTMNADNLTMSGNLTVNGTTTTINTATLDVEDKNITVAKNAADSAAANGGGLTVDGAGATFNYASSGDKWTTNKGLDVGGTLEIDEVLETVGIGTTASGAQDFDLATRSVIYITANQTANRSINFRGDGSTTLDSMMAVGQSISCAALMTQGSTAYYLNSYNVDGTSVTPKWQGGSAPTSGNASGIDVYTFTIIKTASATFTVLATVAQFA
jgi:hypothetical protein